MPVELFEATQSFVKSSKPSFDSDTMKKVLSAIEELKKQKVLIEDPSYDNVVLERFRNLTGKTLIRIAYFILTDQCNFNCSYCFIRKEQRKE